MLFQPCSPAQWQSPPLWPAAQALLEVSVSSTVLFNIMSYADPHAVIEMFLTAQLVFTIFMLAAEKHKGTFIAPIGIGLSLFIAELSGVFFVRAPDLKVSIR